MWVADNNTPFRIDRGFLRDRQGGEVWIVVVKGTFDVGANGRLRLAEEQTAPARVAAWTGEPGKSSLLHDSDFVLTKGGTDILVRGHAYAPRGRPAASVEVALKAGPLTKRVRALGVRAWMRARDGSTVVPGPARPFDRLPIAYEHAFGGLDGDAPPGRPAGSTHNPVGTGFSYRPMALLNRAAPQLESIEAPPAAGPFEVPPVGFGPIAPHWASRARFAGTYDQAWKDSRAPLLPTDFDERFWRSAPGDQQMMGFAPPGLRIELWNLTPDGYLALSLPEMSLKMRVLFTDGEADAAAMLHTVSLQPDQRRVELVWHASLPCHGRDHKLRRAIVNWEGDRSCLSP